MNPTPLRQPLIFAIPRMPAAVSPQQSNAWVSEPWAGHRHLSQVEDSVAPETQGESVMRGAPRLLVLVSALDACFAPRNGASSVHGNAGHFSFVFHR